LAGRAKKGAKEPSLATNRAASYQYHLVLRMEAGLVLTGAEVKSAREGRVSLKEAYAKVAGGEVFLHNAHFTPYSHARIEEGDPRRVRKLLLNRREIRKLTKETETTGMTIVPTRLYLKNGKVKIEIALARGKKQYDKRDSKRRKEMDREIERAGSTRRLR
jgi:SsrA-binding protein